MRTLAVLVILAALASGCATTRAAVPIERPSLDVPPVPPRIVEAAPRPELARPEPVEDLPPPSNAAPTAKPRPAAPREARDAQKPEVKPEAPAADAAPPPPPAQAVPTGTLRTPATADTAAAERQISDTLTRAQTGLNGVDYQRLTAPRKKAYDEAKDFITLAEAALKAANFELARELARKAETYAKELQGR